MLEDIVSHSKLLTTLQRSLYNAVHNLNPKDIPAIAKELRKWFNTCAVGQRNSLTEHPG